MSDVLKEVLTVREAAELFGVHVRTVRRAIDARRYPLEARKSPDTERGTWLVTRASCLKRWGMRHAIARSAHEDRTSPYVDAGQWRETGRS
jgi:hypothetical protein